MEKVPRSASAIFLEQGHNTFNETLMLELHEKSEEQLSSNF